jgi:hypothetical protein
MSQKIDINLDKDGIRINGVFAPKITASFLKSTIGEPRVIEREGKENVVLMWDDLGITASTKDDKENVRTFYLYPHLGEEKRYFDTPASDFLGALTLANRPFLEKIPQKKLSEAYLFIENVRLGDWKINADLSKELTEKIEAYEISHRVENPDEIADLVKNAPHPFHEISISFEPKRISSGKYIHKTPADNVLSFDTFNFKLAVVQVLMYDKELLEPKFDVYDFAKDYTKREIDVDAEGDEPIREAKKWFDALPISAALAKHVEELYLDGGNEIYMQIWPFWDGEDDYFDAKKLSEAELKQFPNLKKITGTANLFSKASKIIEASGIQMEFEGEGEGENQSLQENALTIAMKKLSGRNICLTGLMKIVDRNEVRNFLPRIGGKFVPSNEWKPDIQLVVKGAGAFNAGILKNAEANGVEIIDEQDFAVLFEEVKKQTAK